jgi:hypothetical protein
MRAGARKDEAEDFVLPELIMLLPEDEHRRRGRRQVSLTRLNVRSPQYSKNLTRAQKDRSNLPAGISRHAM